MSEKSVSSAKAFSDSNTDPYRQPLDKVLAALGTDARLGLSQGEVRKRLETYGRNELATEKPVPAWRKFLAQFQDVLVILLLIATVISAGLWMYERETALPYEAIAILAVVMLNAIMGYIQRKPLRRCARCRRRTPMSFETERGRASRRPRSCPVTSFSSRKVTRFPPTGG